jgi:hypothetical protein
MAGVAGDHAASREVGLIDRGHHQNHPAGCLLTGRIVGIPGPTAAAFHAMAKSAVGVQGRGKEAHGGHELAHGDAPEELHALKGVFRHQGFLFLPSLAVRRGDA